MTENEAKYYLLEHKPIVGFKTHNEALDVAINALSEIQQYRAIGTVEELEWCKDASHWKELFKEKLEQYESIGTIEEFKALKECIDCSATVKWTNKNRIEVNGEQFTRVTPIEEDIDWQ